MKITKAKKGFNDFRWEGLTLAKLLTIESALKSDHSILGSELRMFLSKKLKKIMDKERR